MKKCFLLLFAVVCILYPAGLVSAQQICSNQTGTNGGYWYTFWTDGGGSVCMTMGSGGNFSVQWSNCGNFVCGKGWSTGSDRTITWSGSSSNAQYVGVYGWLQNPLVEYYIPRSGGTNKGTYSADGTTYTLYTNQRVNQPSIEGTKTFTQYFCGGNNSRSVNFGQHMAGWRNLGVGVGTHNYQVVAVEGWGGSSGSANITVGGGTTNPTATPTQTRTATPTPTATIGPTPTPNQNPIWSGGPYTLTGASSSYIDLPDGITNNLGDISIACWVNLNALTNWTRIFDFGGDTNVFMMLTPASGSTGYPYFCITTSGNSGEQGINGTSALPTGSWQHLAVVKSGNTGILYINNQEVGRNSGITLRPADLGNTTNNYIGRSQWSQDPYLNADIEHFVIYNRGLSASEVAALYNDKPGGNVVSGDVNDSGSIDIVDALMIAQYSVGLNPAGFNANNADVNCDGSITIVDALMIAQYSVGLIANLSC